MENHLAVYCQYTSGLEKAMMMKEWNVYCKWRQDNPFIQIEWVWGPTGTGKTWSCVYGKDPEVPSYKKICLCGDLN